jgi:ankyrin repeat protein
LGQWDNLFAFRDAAMRDDLAAMRAVLARDSSFMPDENPADLPLEFLAKLHQIQTAAREGPIDTVRRLIEEEPRLARQPWTTQGWLPLSQAVWGDQPETVKLLLAHGARGDDRIAETGGTVLQMAAELDRVEMARMMIEAGADPNLQAPDGSSAASKAKSDEMKRALTK